MSASCTILVVNLSDTATTPTLTEYFCFHGKIEKVVVDGASALVTFGDAAAARSALLFDRATFLGTHISVTLDDSRTSPMRRTIAEASSPEEEDSPPRLSADASGARVPASECEVPRPQPPASSGAPPAATPPIVTTFTPTQYSSFAAAVAISRLNGEREVLGVTLAILAMLAVC